MKSDRSTSKQATTRRETFQTKNEQQVYGVVTHVLGSGHFRCMCDDFLERTCSIRGNMRNRVFVRKDDVVLIDLFIGMNQDDRGVISYRYHVDDLTRIGYA
jgi:translation initiation factor 1A